MFIATINKPKRLLHLNYIGHVGIKDLQDAREELLALLAELPQGFLLLTDLGRLESMDLECETELGRIMELCDEKGVESVARVIPNPQKDIGLNILAVFHYRSHVRAVTCESFEEAVRLLLL